MDKLISNLLPAKLSAVSKTELLQMVNQAAEALVESGEEDLYSLFANVKKQYEALGSFLKNESLQDAILTELHREDHEEKFVGNMKLSAVGGGTRYEYSEDEIWNELKEKLKTREELLKLAQKTEIADPETGEMVPKVAMIPGKERIVTKF